MTRGWDKDVNLPAPREERRLYGRSGEVNTLSRAFAGESRGAAVFVVVGPSGIGKSKLLRQAAEHSGAIALRYDARTSTATASNMVNQIIPQLVEGLAQHDGSPSSRSIGKSVARALRGNLRPIAAAAIMDGVRATAPHLSGTLDSIVSSIRDEIGESDWTDRALRVTDVSDADAVTLLTELTHAVNQAGIRAVFIVDQIERASDSVASAVLALAREKPDEWGCIIATNDETASGVRWLSEYWPDFAYLGAERLELQPLSRSAVEEWHLDARGVLPPPEELGRVLAWTQGRPLILEEWISGDTTVDQLASAWDRIGPYYAGRINRLPAEGRSLLRKLALLPDGSIFGFGVLHGLAGKATMQETHEIVTGLITDMFLVEAQSTLGEPAYRFRHSVIHLHALHGLPRELIQELASSVLEVLRGSGLLEAELEGWTLGRLAIASRDAEDGPAAALNAGRLLNSRGLFIDAEELLSDALVAFPHSEQQSVLTVARCESLIGLGRYVAAVQELDGMGTASAPGLLARGRALLRLNRYADAESALAQATELYRTAGDVVGVISSSRERVTIERDQGRYSSAVELSEGLLASLAPEAPTAVRAAVLRAVARSLALAGEPEQAVRFAEAALELAEGFSESSTATAYLALGEAHRHALDFERGLSAYRESARVARATGNRDCYLWAQLGAGDCLRLEGDVTSARAEIGQASNWVRSAGVSHPLESLHYGFLEGTLLLTEHAEMARSSIDLSSVVAEYDTIGIHWPRAWLAAVPEQGLRRPLPF